MPGFTPLLDILAEVPCPQGAERKLQAATCPAVLDPGDHHRLQLVSRHRPFIDVHRRRLNRSFGLKWRRAPSHTPIRYILQGLDPGCTAIDGKTLRCSFGRFHDRTAAHVLSAVATDTKLMLAHVEIGEKSSEIHAALPRLHAEVSIAEDAIITPDALLPKKRSTSPRPATSASSSRSRKVNRR